MTVTPFPVGLHHHPVVYYFLIAALPDGFYCLTYCLFFTVCHFTVIFYKENLKLVS